MSSLLYGCESWVSANIKPVQKLYNWALKELLGVRRATTNNVCYAELGYPSLPYLLSHKQHKFFHSMWSERHDMTDDPFSFTLRYIMALNTSLGKLISHMANNDAPVMSSLMSNVHDAITNSQSTRCNVYKTINPQFKVHDAYVKRYVINDTHRISFTRFRIIGHSLAVETGRWNRRGRGRLPVDECLCVCGNIQTEQYVTEVCPHTQHIRDRNGFTSLRQLLSSFTDTNACKFIHEILNIYS